VIHVYVMLQTVHVCLKQIQFLLLDQKALLMQHLKILVNYSLSYFYSYIYIVNCLHIDNIIIVSSFIYSSLVFLRVYWNTHTMIGMMTYENLFSFTWLTHQTDRLNAWMEQMRCYTKKKKGILYVFRHTDSSHHRWV
jgi:hypothetical protein